MKKMYDDWFDDESVLLYASQIDTLPDDLRHKFNSEYGCKRSIEFYRGL